MESTTINPEDKIVRAWDKCATDTALKLGGGLLMGSLFSLLFFKRKIFPIIIGAGFGLGMAASNCERDLNNSLQVNSCQPTKEK